MYVFWWILFISQPHFMFLGLSGLFGEEARKVADEILEIWGIAAVLLIALAVIAGLVYLIFKFMGVEL